MFTCAVCSTPINTRSEPLNRDIDLAAHNKSQLRFPFKKGHLLDKEGRVISRKIAPVSHYWNASLHEIYCCAGCSLQRHEQLKITIGC